MGDLEQERESSEVEGRSQKINFFKILQVDSYLWKESKWKSANKKVVRSCNRGKERVCAKKEEGVPTVKKREKRSMWVYWRIIKEGIYQTLEVISNGTYFFVGKKNSKKRIVQNYRHLNE